MISFLKQVIGLTALQNAKEATARLQAEIALLQHDVARLRQEASADAERLKMESFIMMRGNVDEAVAQLRGDIEILRSNISELKEKHITEVMHLKADAEKLTNENEQLTNRRNNLLKTDKEKATANNDPYVAVVDTKVNPDNLRFGFFELDWNDLFIRHLIIHGFGTDHDPEEEIVDRWFRGVCQEMLAAHDIEGVRYGGYLNTRNIGNNLTEIG